MTRPHSIPQLRFRHARLTRARQRGRRILPNREVVLEPARGIGTGHHAQIEQHEHRLRRTCIRRRRDGRLPGGIKGQRTAPKRMGKPADELEVRAHSDYSTRGRTNNHVEDVGEHDPLPVSCHRNSATRSAGCKFRGARGY
jgi:hypothetical protein